jgi:hypothetical protein
MIGLLSTTVATQVLTSGWLTGTGIVVDADVPGDSDLRIAFKAGGVWKGYNGAAWANLPTQAITANSVLSEGSAVAQIEAASDISWMLNTNVDIALALSTGSGNASPVVRSIELVGSTGSEQLAKTVTSSPVILSSSAVEILGVDDITNTSGSGSVNITASLQREDSSWSDYMPLANIKGEFAKAVVFRVELSVAATGGSNGASVAKISLSHRTDNVATFTEGIGRIVTVTLDLYNDQSKIHAMVKWTPVKDASIRAYASFRTSPVQVTDEVLGVADGTTQHFDLAHPEKVAPHTIAVKFNGLPTSSFSFNSSTGQLTVTAAASTAITASYEYNWEPEEWRPMTHEASYPDTQNVLLINEQFNLTTHDTGPIVSFMVEAEQGKGEVEGESLGVATGIEMPYILAHKPRPETIVVRANGPALPGSQFHYSEEGGVLFVTSTVGDILTVDYLWLGNPPEVARIAAIWNR